MVEQKIFTRRPEFKSRLFQLQDTTESFLNMGGSSLFYNKTALQCMYDGYQLCHNDYECRQQIIISVKVVNDVAPWHISTIW